MARSPLIVCLNLSMSSSCLLFPNHIYSVWGSTITGGTNIGPHAQQQQPRPRPTCTEDVSHPHQPVPTILSESKVILVVYVRVYGFNQLEKLEAGKAA